MVGIPKYHSSGKLYMYNIKTRRIIINRDIKQAPFIRPSFYERLDEVLRHREIQKENAQQGDEDGDEDENNSEEDINLGGGNDLDNMENDVEKITHP